jgi:hypothetical protein
MIGEKFPLNPPPAVPIAIIILLYRYGVKIDTTYPLQRGSCYRVVSLALRIATL